MRQKFYREPFATAGDKEAIPDELQPSGTVSYNQGWGFDYQRDQESDPAAKPVERQSMNDVLFDITNNLRQYQITGVPEFITPEQYGTTDSPAPCPYAKNVMVRWSASGNEPMELFVSLEDNNTATPADETKWATLENFILRYGLPSGTEEGQVPIWNQSEGKWEPGFISGKKLGELVFLPYDADDSTFGLFQISYHQNTPLALSDFPNADISKLACPSAYNATADFFYRCNNEDGTGRNPSGNILMLPAAAKYFFRGFDPDGGVEQYQYQEDQIQGHNHKLEGGIIGQTGGTAENSTLKSGVASLTADGWEAKTIISDGVNGPPRIGGETRPMSIAAFRVFMKIYDSATVPVDMDIAALVASFNSMAGLKLNKVDDDNRTSYLYPNGGTAETPATVTPSQRFVMDNPFPGYEVHCEAQIQISNKFGITGWMADNGGSAWGVMASQLLPDDTIVTQVAYTKVITTSGYSGNPFGITADVTSAPCRVKVTRQGKIQ